MWERLVALGAGFGGGSGGAGAGVKEEKDPGTVGGTKLRILKYPHPKLRAPNLPITSFDAALTQTATEMLMVMYAADGIGLAAPQVGVNMNLMVFNEKDDKEHEMILCNPEVVGASGIMALGEEGCLSFPQIYGQVQRNTWVEVSYQTLAGERVNRRFEGKPAIIFQHEFDHLDKVLFIDRLEEEDKKLNQKRLEKYVKKYGAGAAP
ncbi:dubious peptide deformylase [Ochromonadaceae sp. CCMP2298]|nr:dubious peptide deformylase [Ochromonadaceae sp. CCMP2298]